MHPRDSDQSPHARDPLLGETSAGGGSATGALDTSLTELHRHVDELAGAWKVRDTVTLRALVEQLQRGAAAHGLVGVARCAASIDEALTMYDEAESADITESIESMILLCARAVTGEGPRKQ